MIDAMEAPVPNAIPLGRCPHPNDLDLKRIKRALQARKRYRYVRPKVLAVAGGYRIESPCCSRNIDADGGIIDVALLQYDLEQNAWQIYRKDHRYGTWELHSTSLRLPEVLERLNTDPERKFWQ
jgi:hypothetical protein